jgi:hypothetical protein
MYSRWYNLTVIVFWLATMTWLVTQKVMPPLLPGEPPNFHTILEAQQREPLVGWSLSLDNRQMGWALTTITPLLDGSTEIRSDVRFDRLPLKQLTSGWLEALSRLPLASRLIDSSLEKLHLDTSLQMDARSTLTIDARGQLSRLDCVVRLSPVGERIRLSGVVKGTHMTLAVQWGDYDDPDCPKRDIPIGGLLGDDFSPRTQLPGLYKGQTWKEPTYNPLRFGDPVENLQATVEGTEPVVWNDQAEDVWLVVYRNDAGFRFGADSLPRGRLWVRRDGTVLKQQVYVFGASLVFERLPQAEALELQRSLDGGR